MNIPLKITNFFLAMQAGPHGIVRLGALFAEDAVYSEPFSGSADPHVGRQAIMQAFSASRTDAFDDAVIHLSRVTVDGSRIEVDWTCISKAIPGGQGSGTNIFEMRGDLIASLQTTLKVE